MMTVDQMANEVFAKLGLTGVDADLTVADTGMVEVDDTVIVLGELSVTELKLFGAMRAACEGLEALRTKAMSTLMHKVADRLGEATHVPGVGFALGLSMADMIGALPPNTRTEFNQLSAERDAANSVLFLALRKRLNSWGSIEIRRGGKVCIPREQEKN
jgi:hypothetical protein